MIAGFGEDGVQRLIVIVARGGFDFLAGVGQADDEHRPGGAQGLQRAVVVAAALAQPETGPVEGQQGRDDQIGDQGRRRRGRGRDAGRVGLQRLVPERRCSDAEDVADLLRVLGPLTTAEVVERSGRSKFTEDGPAPEPVVLPEGEVARWLVSLASAHTRARPRGAWYEGPVHVAHKLGRGEKGGGYICHTH